ncbi:MAG: monovalent cation/H(+) antiporter subunit G [Verrucomicrobiaceae bacterium]|jgi:monovalent cation/proton antiporter MnhG/PhaG subunit|nr:MAG: monovalent cation/H(+) antiporter subunit G [Verrucomicrobiaceae bacterium]
MKEILIQIFCVLGSVAVFLAAIGMLRFPDFFTRTHAATKASAFGLACFLLAACLDFPQINVILKSLFALIALFITLPVASQALADAVRKNDKGGA